MTAGALVRVDPQPLPPAPLRRVRAVIDCLDDGLLLLLAGRRRLARAAAHCKREAGLPLRDPARESEVRRRARSLGRRLALPPPLVERVLDLAIADARRSQGLEADLDQGGPGASGVMLEDTGPALGQSDIRMLPPPLTTRSHHALLRRLPPPARLAPLLRRIPGGLQRRLLEAAMARVLAQPLADGALEFMRGRRLGIEVADLGLAWVIELADGRLRACAPGVVAEASVRGSATDLLRLASRLEDADTLFFQRRLVLTGDTELGLTARNLLDALPWESVPLGLRIALNRAARLARAARAAYRGESAS